MEFAVGTATVYVSDFDRSLEFYDVTLGLPLGARDDDYGYASFATQGARFAIARVAPDNPEAQRMVGRETGITLLVPDLDAAHAALLERGVAFPIPPSTQPWGGRLAQLEDPDGNRIVLEEGAAEAR